MNSLTSIFRIFARHFPALILLLLLLLAFPAIGWAQDKPDTVKISGTVSFINGKIRLTGLNYAVEKEGWLRSELAKRGVKFEWYPVSGTATGPLTNEAFANHVIQFASYGDLPSIILNSNGAGETSQLLLPTNSEDSYLVVPKDSSARSIDDLKGKRIAIHKGRPWELPLLRLLDSKGLRYSDFQIYNIDPQAGAAAVATGGVDALFTLSAYSLEDKGIAKIIWSTKEAPKDWKIGIGLWGAKEFVDKQPELTQLVVTAYVKASYWASQEANKEEIIQQQSISTGNSEELTHKSYDDPSLSWQERWSPLFSPDVYSHYKVDIGYAFDKKIIRKAISVDDLLNPRFVNQALQDLQLQSYWSDGKPAAVAQGSPSPVPPISSHK